MYSTSSENNPFSRRNSNALTRLSEVSHVANSILNSKPQNFRYVQIELQNYTSFDMPSESNFQFTIKTLRLRQQRRQMNFQTYLLD